MKHQLQVSVSKKPTSDSFVKFKRITIRERIVRFLFGKRQDMMIMIPNDRISEVIINKKGD
ncbi:hypothetical protein HO476_06970 [Streptococcus suis]|nr:hypothetical protein [Streptococcus suis]HEM4119382.1 hypothetical protein [Streptococcus suis]HEM4120047.1 hypothetical protein [Streptococcus suis]